MIKDQTILSGTFHKIPDDIKKTLMEDNELLEKWNKLTNLARNEWICWTISVKQEKTREKHIKRLKEDILNGKKRPCCWAGCSHKNENFVQKE